MEVKVFVEEQKTSLISDPIEWINKVKELGLNAQQDKFVIHSDDENTGVVNPFPRMTKEMANVYRLFLPDHVHISKYNDDPIPLKALGAYGLAVKERYFTVVDDVPYVEIWHAFGKPDPLMVGVIKRSYSEYEYYMMAQWGPEIISFEKMRDKVLGDLCIEIKAKTHEVLATVKAMLDGGDEAFMTRAIDKLKTGNSRIIESVYF